MAQQRLGVQFDGALAALTDPPLTIITRDFLYPRPLAGALAALIATLPDYHVIIVGGAYSAVMIHGWSAAAMLAYFSAAGVDNPESHAKALVRELDIRDGDPGRIDRWVRSSTDWPDEAERRATWKDPGNGPTVATA